MALLLRMLVILQLVSGVAGAFLLWPKPQSTTAAFQACESLKSQGMAWPQCPSTFNRSAEAVAPPWSTQRSVWP